MLYSTKLKNFSYVLHNIFSSLAKWLRRPDEMALRGASGRRAVVWRPLV